MSVSRKEIASDDSTPAFAIRRDGSGVKMDWRALLAITSAAIFIGGAYWTLQDHGKRIDTIATKVDADHEILLEIRGALRRSPIEDRR